MRSKLYNYYKNTIIKDLIRDFGYKNIHQVPKIVKININRGLGEDGQNSKVLENNMNEISLITGQKPIITYAKKSISGFKIREKTPIGIAVTLRKEKMYIFLEKLIHLALPRIRDFRGINTNSFDGRGNYNLGIKEQLIFPEIEYDKIDKIRGMDINIVTTALNDLEAKRLLTLLGMPFRKDSL
uniref:ribosomal protein L5 n=1 Tax=Galdieria phlegrea TaxID=1389228 RepID=UPI0023D7BFE6|nr:ribosomal protein L5 [Galdieria phlegrea]UNJ16227.1 ribosomal protein L5 [Galdieria sp.]WDA99721.1 ribosomal protein L5 [Galdieria sulphuraria]WDA99913.1 ribosomal protein L5 [Galdieria phlegrea]